MNMVAFLLALLAAVVGAAAWGGISYLTNYEIGYVAWGIGLLVGGAARVAGASGKVSGVCCGILALVSIFTGKVLAIEFAAPAEVRKAVAQSATSEIYEEMKVDAADFAALASQDQHAAFMIEHEYADAAAPEDVAADQIAFFRATFVPILAWMHSDSPAYDAWKDRYVKAMTSKVLEEMPSAEFALSDLNFIDIIFALLGIGTAYKLGSMGGPDEIAA